MTTDRAALVARIEAEIIRMQTRPRFAPTPIDYVDMLRDVLSLLDAAPAPGWQECEAGCICCSGEACMEHDEPCQCNTADRHKDAAGNLFVGITEGMRRRR
jgi:hypothetical protein